MSNQVSHHALCAQSLPTASEGSDVPSWVHLLPVSEGDVSTSDNRGPYHVTNAAQIISASFAEADRLPIDENHATDLAAPKGHPAPARGWIVEMQARADGIWGRVEWTEEGRALVASRAYRALSPVIALPHKKATEITGILRASLVNRPNLRGLAALNMENDDMPFLETVAGLLGLGADASESDIQSKITVLMGDESSVALQSQLSEIATALGVEDGGDVLAAAKAANTGAAQEGGSDQVVALQSAVTELQAENVEQAKTIKALTGNQTKIAAETFVDGQIEKGRAGVKPLRDHYISMHQQDPARVEKEITALPLLGVSGTTVLPPVAEDGAISLNAEQTATAELLGISQDDYTKTLKAEREAKGAI